jgi:hypothetical protein
VSKLESKHFKGEHSKLYYFHCVHIVFACFVCLLSRLCDCLCVSLPVLNVFKGPFFHLELCLVLSVREVVLENLEKIIFGQEK